jgi:hypothetical protein
MKSKQAKEFVDEHKSYAYLHRIFSKLLISNIELSESCICDLYTIKANLYVNPDLDLKNIKFNQLEIFDVDTGKYIARIKIEKSKNLIYVHTMSGFTNDIDHLCPLELQFDILYRKINEYLRYLYSDLNLFGLEIFN